MATSHRTYWDLVDVFGRSLAIAQIDYEEGSGERTGHLRAAVDLAQGVQDALRRELGPEFAARFLDDVGHVEHDILRTYEQRQQAQAQKEAQR